MHVFFFFFLTAWLMDRTSLWVVFFTLDWSGIQIGLWFLKSYAHLFRFPRSSCRFKHISTTLCMDIQESMTIPNLRIRVLDILISRIGNSALWVLWKVIFLFYCGNNLFLHNCQNIWLSLREPVYDDNIAAQV